jgi:polyketide biosynthesis acyl carrier protein
LTREKVWEIVARNIRQMLPDLPPERICSEVSMSDLGADSMDRMDVVIGAMDELGLELSGASLAGVHDIGSLVDALYAYADSEQPRSAADNRS